MHFVCPFCVCRLLLHIRALWEMAIQGLLAMMSGYPLDMMAHAINFTTMWSILAPMRGQVTSV